MCAVFAFPMWKKTNCARGEFERDFSNFRVELPGGEWNNNLLSFSVHLPRKKMIGMKEIQILHSSRDNWGKEFVILDHAPC